MKNKRFILIISGLILFSAIVLRIHDYTKKDDNKKEINIIENKIENEVEIVVKENDYLKIIEPLENELISSPYKIRGIVSSNLLKNREYFFILLNKENEIITLTKLETSEDYLKTDSTSFYAWLEFYDLDGLYKISLREKRGVTLINPNILKDININIR